jgi:Kef-type K+ transport system membrane component KefB
MQLSGLKNYVFAGEDAFVDTLMVKIGPQQIAPYKAQILQHTHYDTDFFQLLLLFVAHIGLLLFLMQLGFNFDHRLFKLNDTSFLPRAMLILALDIVLLGGAAYYLLSKENLLFSIFLTIAFLSIHLGAVLSVNFPITLSMKKPLKNVVQIAVLLDIFAIILFTVLSYSLRYRQDGIAALESNLVYFLIACFFILPIGFPSRMERVFQSLQRLGKAFIILFKAGLFFIFLYLGHRAGISILFLGIWAGLLLRVFAASHQMEVNQRFLSIASFLYVIPFAEVGRSLVVAHSYSGNFGSRLLILLLVLAVISILASLTGLRKKAFPLILSLGTFPRGEIALLILWLLKNTYLLSASDFVVSAIAVIITSFLGSLLARVIFTRPFRFQRRVKSS